jgi:hypothetical protein
MGTVRIWGYFNLFAHLLVCHPYGYTALTAIWQFNDNISLCHTDDCKRLSITWMKWIVDCDKANFMSIL